jgi:hypothetical protein
MEMASGITGKVTQRIGGKQDRAATVMDFINAQHA